MDSAHNIPCNESQRKAVEHNKGHLLIVAGPGTGKTHTLTQRIIHTYRRSPKEKILAITFTNKAAGEMKERIERILEQKPQNIFIGTFHQLCLNFLTDCGKMEGFNILDEKTQEMLAKELWPDANGPEIRRKLENISQWKSSFFLSKPDIDVEKYNHFIRSKGFYDFDDLLLETYKAWQKEDENPYAYVFVDEYQDINKIQHEFLKCLVSKEAVLTAIGDPNQCIYSFRGADINIFNSFADDFKGACIMPLMENYRSAENILKASSQVMQAENLLSQHALIPRMYEEGRLIIHLSSTEKSEAEYIVHAIEKLVGGISMFSHDSFRVHTGSSAEVGFGDIAILYRLKGQRHALIKALERSGIPYHVVGEKTYDKEDESACPLRQENTDILGDRVLLMTMHASKGLEFSAVFVIGCEDNLLPLNIHNLKSDADEERRLFYVAMTRAKNWLFLTHVKKRNLFGRLMYQKPSVFLESIEEKLKEYEQPQAKAKIKRQDDQLTLFN